MLSLEYPFPSFHLLPLTSGAGCVGSPTYQWLINAAVAQASLLWLSCHGGEKKKMPPGHSLSCDWRPRFTSIYRLLLFLSPSLTSLICWAIRAVLCHSWSSWSFPCWVGTPVLGVIMSCVVWFFLIWCLSSCTAKVSYHSAVTGGAVLVVILFQLNWIA